MNLLFSSQIKNQIKSEITTTTDDLQIISAYCKENAVQFIQNSITAPIRNKRLMVRFTLDDILYGASDLSIYKYCKTNGWKLYLRFDLHAKTYIFDKKRCIIGNANLTSRGIGISQTANYEIATFAKMDNKEQLKIDRLFSNAILVTDELFQKMELQVEISNQSPALHKKQLERRYFIIVCARLFCIIYIRLA